MAELQGLGYLGETTPNSGKRGRPAKVFYLNEQQALLICMFSRTEKAAAVPGLDRVKKDVEVRAGGVAVAVRWADRRGYPGGCAVGLDLNGSLRNFHRRFGGG